MHIDSSSPSKQRQLAINCLIATVNDLDHDIDRVLTTLVENNYLGASDASAENVTLLKERSQGLVTLARSLPTSDTRAAATALNAELKKHSVSPHLYEHNGSGLHVHWTDESAAFHDQVLIDLLMTLADVLGAEGTDRFGICDAARCGRMYYDHTRNHSRRFCSDPSCANRTHVAEHRKRQSE